MTMTGSLPDPVQPAEVSIATGLPAEVSPEPDVPSHEQLADDLMLVHEQVSDGIDGYLDSRSASTEADSAQAAAARAAEATQQNIAEQRAKGQGNQNAGYSGTLKGGW